MKFKFGLTGFLIVLMLTFLSCSGKKEQADNTNFQDYTEEKDLDNNNLYEPLESNNVDTDDNVPVIEESIQEMVLPPKVNLFQYKKKSHNPSYGYPDARIWGWSKKGKTAYSIETFIDGRGGRIINFVIMDLITDKAVYELEIDSFNFDDVDNDRLYDIFKIEILKALKEHDIASGTTPYLSFPFKRNNIEYNANIIDVEYKDDEYGFFDKVVSGYKVSVSANNRSKIIDSSPAVRRLTGFVYVCGSFISPFENRAMVVIAEEAMVFEGTEIFYRFAGCHLGSGFN